MTVEKGWAFQQDVFTRVSAALPGVPGFTGQPKSPPPRFFRLDGFTLLPDETYKNREQARHGVTIHVFDRPAGGTGSLQWVRQQIAAVHLALKGVRLDGLSQPLSFETASFTFDPKPDAVTDAHGLIRFTATIGA